MTDPEPRPGARPPSPADDKTRRGYARLAGVLYPLVIVVYMAGMLTAGHVIGDGSFSAAASSVAGQPALLRFGLLLQLLASMLTVALAFSLYALLRPADPLLALQALIWRLAEAAVGAAATVIAFGRPALYLAHAGAAGLDPAQGEAALAVTRAAHGAGFAASILFFSVGSTLFYLLFRRTELLPRWLSALGVSASVLTACVGASLLLWPEVSVVEIGWLPIFVAELLTGLWLLLARWRPGTATGAMASPAPVSVPRQRARLGWRIGVPLLAAVPIALLISVDSTTPLSTWLVRAWAVAIGTAIAFAACERWPARLPAWLARWVFQLLGMTVAVPLAAYAGYWLTTGQFMFWVGEPGRLRGFLSLTFAGVLFGPWIALAAMVRARDAVAHEQALAFAVERGQLERQAVDARLRLLQAQVQPHFLFNTLANVRALVATGSPQAPAVLDSLIAYLHAVVPRLDEPAATVGDEIRLVRAYLALMQMRMPDRLQYAIAADEAALRERCLPLSLLTLVENSVRHGIDPGEQGGRIEVSVQRLDGRCLLRVIDSGVGLTAGSGSGGTGLANLRERLRLAWGEDAQLRLTEVVPHGVCAEIDYPITQDRE